MITLTVNELLEKSCWNRDEAISAVEQWANAPACVNSIGEILVNRGGKRESNFGWRPVLAENIDAILDQEV